MHSPSPRKRFFLLFISLFLFSSANLSALVREITQKIQGITCKKEVVENQLTMLPCFFQWQDLKIYADTSMNSSEVVESDWREIHLLQKGDAEYINTLFFFEYGVTLVFVTEQSAGLSEGHLITIDCFNAALDSKWGSVIQSSNLGIPLVKDGYLYVTSLERIAKVRLNDGKAVWATGWPVVHLFESFKQPIVVMNNLVFPDAASDKRVILDEESGKIIKMDE